jgi:AmmeMemoRadiSam system protein A
MEKKSQNPPGHPYTVLVRKALEYYFDTGRKPVSAARLIEPLADESLSAPSRGVFVSLHKNGDLRGCIGTIMGTQPTLGEEIRQNTFSAAFRDPRFPPLEKSELDALEINVDVLSDMERTTRDQLDPKKYGVMVTSGFRRGLLLPDLELVDDVDTQLSIALRKGGIRPDEDYVIDRFTVTRYKE